LVLLACRETAFCVAIEVLNSGRQTLPHSKLSGCNWETAQIGTHNMLAKSTATTPPLVGVVRPVCTVAAISAAIVLADEDYFLCCYRGATLKQGYLPHFFAYSVNLLA
jgi:hypothetical protein